MDSKVYKVFGGSHALSPHAVVEIIIHLETIENPLYCTSYRVFDILESLYTLYISIERA